MPSRPGRPGRVRRAAGILVFAVLISFVAAWTLFLVKVYSDVLRRTQQPEPPAAVETASQPGEAGEPLPPAAGGDRTVLKLYFPAPGGMGLASEERSVRRVSSILAIAEAVVREFLAGPAGRPGPAEEDPATAKARLKGVYYGKDSVLYLDFTDSFHRNFQGSAEDEYYLLKALDASIMANVYQVKGVKVLVEGKEVDTVGGHLSVRGILHDAVSTPPRRADEG